MAKNTTFFVCLERGILYLCEHIYKVYPPPYEAQSRIAGQGVLLLTVAGNWTRRFNHEEANSQKVIQKVVI